MPKKNTKVTGLMVGGMQGKIRQYLSMQGIAGHIG